MNKALITIFALAVAVAAYLYGVSQKTPSQPAASTSQEAVIEEHADQKPDLALVVSESIVGTWQSVDDKKFLREFKANGTSIDYYDGKVSSTDTWKAFTIDKPLPTYAPLEKDTPYVQLMTEENMALNFKVTKLTPDELELVYLDRGGMLTFTRIKN